MASDPDQFRVSPSLQGLPGVEAPAVESAAPAMLVRAGQTIQRASAAGSEVYREILREQNATRVTEALVGLTEYQNELTYGLPDDPMRGWAAQQGKNALERPNEMSLDEEYGSQFEERVQQLALGLGNDAQRRMFQERAQAMGADLRGRIQSHVAEQGFKYRQDTLTAVINSGQRLMGTASDPLDIARSGDMVRQAASQLADMRGLADEARDDFYREALTPGHLGALSRLQSLEDVDGAEAYFNAHRDEISYDAAVKIEASLLEQRGIMEGREIGESLAAGAAAQGAASAPQEVGMPILGAFRRTGGFGEQRPGHRHGGIDMAVPMGTAVHAGASGVARVKRDPKGYGIYVDLKLDDGTTLRMAHLDSTEIKDGDRVEKGQVIAKSGNSGRSTGPHLHYEVIGADGTKQDPMAWHQGKPKIAAGSAPNSRFEALQRLNELNLPPRQHAEAQQAINSYFSAKREAEDEQKDNIISQATAEIDRNGSLSSGTLSSVIAAGLGASIPSLRSFEKATQERRAGKTISEADGLVAYGTVLDAIRIGRVKNNADLLQYKPFLPDNYLKQLTDYLKNPELARQRAENIVKLMDAEIEGTGLFRDDDGKQNDETRKEYARFVGSVERQIRAEEERSNAPISQERQREIVLGMVGQQVISATGERRAGYQIETQYRNIPASERARIVRSLQRSGTAVPSQRQVVSTWLRMQGQ